MNSWFGEKECLIYFTVMKKNKVTFSYHKEDVVWTNYDDMGPTGTQVTSFEVEFKPTDDIGEYFNKFFQFLLESGFTDEEIKAKLRRYYSHEEVSFVIRPTKKEAVTFLSSGSDLL